MRSLNSFKSTIMHQETKSLWRQRITIEIKLVELIEREVIEVVSYCPEIDQEGQRKYFKREAIVAQLSDHIAAKIEEKKELLLRQHLSSDEANKQASESRSHIEKSMVAQYIVSRLDVLRKSPAFRVKFNQFYQDKLDENTHELTTLCLLPKGVIPYPRLNPFVEADSIVKDTLKLGNATGLGKSIGKECFDILQRVATAFTDALDRHVKADGKIWVKAINKVITRNHVKTTMKRLQELTLLARPSSALLSLTRKLTLPKMNARMQSSVDDSHILENTNSPRIWKKTLHSSFYDITATAASNGKLSAPLAQEITRPERISAQQQLADSGSGEDDERNISSRTVMLPPISMQIQAKADRNSKSAAPGTGSPTIHNGHIHGLRHVQKMGSHMKGKTTNSSHASLLSTESTAAHNLKHIKPLVDTNNHIGQRADHFEPSHNRDKKSPVSVSAPSASHSRAFSATDNNSSSETYSKNEMAFLGNVARVYDLEELGLEEDAKLPSYMRKTMKSRMYVLETLPKKRDNAVGGGEGAVHHHHEGKETANIFPRHARRPSFITVGDELPDPYEQQTDVEHSVRSRSRSNSQCASDETKRSDCHGGRGDIQQPGQSMPSTSVRGNLGNPGNHGSYGKTVPTHHSGIAQSSHGSSAHTKKHAQPMHRQSSVLISSTSTPAMGGGNTRDSSRLVTQVEPEVIIGPDGRSHLRKMLSQKHLAGMANKSGSYYSLEPLMPAQDIPQVSIFSRQKSFIPEDFVLSESDERVKEKKEEEEGKGDVGGDRNGDRMRSAASSAGNTGKTVGIVEVTLSKIPSVEENGGQQPLILRHRSYSESDLDPYDYAILQLKETPLPASQGKEKERGQLVGD